MRWVSLQECTVPILSVSRKEVTLGQVDKTVASTSEVQSLRTMRDNTPGVQLRATVD
jgi:hypothetical protein